jgi:DHA1 family bicyclomycin/chloramphenicol resistance-like MFS transporter
MAIWLVVSAFLGVGFWALVVGVAAFVGCVSMVSSNAMAVILDEFPHMAGTASSLAGTFRFGIGAIVGALLSMATTFGLADAVGDGILRNQLHSLLSLRQRPQKRLIKHTSGPNRAFLLMHINQTFVRLPCVCLFYVKSICVKSHIIVFKKVELDRRNGYI